MKVLMISTNTLPAAPSGPAYIAGAARDAHHIVRVFERLFAGDLETELSGVINEFQPDIVGISIRLVFGDELDPQAPFGTRHTDLRAGVKEIVEVVRHSSNAFIVLGGPGFNYYAVDWLNYLGLDYGLRGEAEASFPLFLQQLETNGPIETIPGCVFRKNGGFGFTPPRPVEDLDATSLPAYDLFEMDNYAAHGISPAIFTKRGCAFDCTFCPYSKLEGKRYRLKSPERVVTEIRHIQQHTPCKRVTFCENSFNVPRSHAESICRALISHPLDIHWGTGDLKPVRVTTDFCQLMADAGCDSVNLAIESASEEMLKRMKRGYTVRQVSESLEALSRSGLPFSASLMIGAPGETPGTIRESLQILADYEIPNGVWVTIGVYLWTDLQEIVSDLRQAGLLEGVDLFSGKVYLPPVLTRSYFEDLLIELRARPGYQVQVNKSTSLFA
jgi:radical SAM superfamily enzyme YgiQ (UPF0313 family)